MKIIWDEGDIGASTIVGNRSARDRDDWSKPYKPSRWMIVDCALFAKPTENIAGDTWAWALLDLYTGDVSKPQTRAQIAQFLNETGNVWPQELFHDKIKY